MAWQVNRDLAEKILERKDQVEEGKAATELEGKVRPPPSSIYP